MPPNKKIKIIDENKFEAYYLNKYKNKYVYYYNVYFLQCLLKYIFHSLRKLEEIKNQRKKMAEKVEKRKNQIKEIHQRVVNDYLETFKIKNNGTIKATNKNVNRIRNFLDSYQDLLIGLGYDLHEIQPIECAGKGDIIKINENKVKMLKLFGVANQLYLSSCCTLRIQPDYNYINLQIITSVKMEDDVKTENNIKK